MCTNCFVCLPLWYIWAWTVGIFFGRIGGHIFTFFDRRQLTMIVRADRWYTWVFVLFHQVSSETHFHQRILQHIMCCYIFLILIRIKMKVKRKGNVKTKEWQTMHAFMLNATGSQQHSWRLLTFALVLTNGTLQLSQFLSLFTLLTLKFAFNWLQSHRLEVRLPTLELHV